MGEFKQSHHYQEGSGAGGRGEGSQWVPVAEAMALRYSGPTSPEQLAASYGWERYLVKLVPTEKLTTWQGADWSPRYFDPGHRPDLEAQAPRPPSLAHASR